MEHEPARRRHMGQSTATFKAARNKWPAAPVGTEPEAVGQGNGKCVRAQGLLATNDGVPGVRPNGWHGRHAIALGVADSIEQLGSCQQLDGHTTIGRGPVLSVGHYFIWPYIQEERDLATTDHWYSSVSAPGTMSSYVKKSFFVEGGGIGLAPGRRSHHDLDARPESMIGSAGESKPQISPECDYWARWLSH